MLTSGLGQLDLQSGAVYIFSDGSVLVFYSLSIIISVVWPSVPDQHRWPHSACIWWPGLGSRHIRDLTVYVRVLTFAAAAQVASEQWVLLDLDRGVLNHSLLLYLRAEREGTMGGSGAKFNEGQKCRGRLKGGNKKQQRITLSVRGQAFESSAGWAAEGRSPIAIVCRTFRNNSGSVHPANGI